MYRRWWRFREHHVQFLYQEYLSLHVVFTQNDEIQNGGSYVGVWLWKIKKTYEFVSRKTSQFSPRKPQQTSHSRNELEE